MDSLFSFFTRRENRPVAGVNVTFTAHKVFDDDVKTIELKERLSSENVMRSVRNCAECNFENNDISLIQRSFDVDNHLSNDVNVSKLSGVFIHDKYGGRLMISSLEVAPERTDGEAKDHIFDGIVSIGI